MKIEKEFLDTHEVKLNVTIDDAEFEPMRVKAAKKIASSTKTPGFRPGKAPYDIIRRNYGDLAIAQEALDIMLEEKYSDILKEAEIEPGGMGRLEKIDQVNPPVFSIIIPLKATVELGNYRDVREDYKEDPITDEDIKNALDNLKQPYATAEPAEGPVEDGESVYVMIKGELDEALEEGGTKELVKEMPYEFVIGKDNDAGSAWPYPEYTKSLIGANKGDVVTSEYIYPDDSVITSLRGHKATFTTTIQEIKKLVMPEETDEFAKSLGDYESFAALLEEVKKHLQDERKRTSENEYIEKIIKKICDGAKVEYSPSDMEEEIEERVADFKNRIARQGIDLETYLKMKKTDMEKFVETEIKPVAEEQLKRKLVLQEFSATEKIQLDYEKVKELMAGMTAYAQHQMGTIKSKKQRDQLTNSITEQAINESFLTSVFGRMMSIAKGENPAIETEDPAEIAAKAAVMDATGDTPVVIDSQEVVDVPADDKKED